MGGTALKIAKTRRYEKDEFVKVTNELSSILSKYGQFELTKSYKSKDSFGDADFLYKDEGLKIYDLIKEVFNPTEIFVNTSVYSFDYKELQVDIIKIREDNWESAVTYYSYNDINNLIGKIARGFGLSWGFDGLKYKLFTKNRNLLGTIYLTKDKDRAFSLLGFDPKKFDDGFEDLEDMFNYIVSNKYYDKDQFLFEKQTKVNRDRDKKRKTYNNFLEFTKNIESKYTFFMNSDAYLSKIDDNFEGFKDKYNEIVSKNDNFVKSKEKINCKVLKELYFTDMPYPKIAKMIKDLKEKLGEDYHTFIINTDIDLIIKNLVSE